LIVVAPVLVTVDAPKTAKLCAEPRKDGTADAGDAAHRTIAIGTARRRRLLADFIRMHLSITTPN
jgi:hypothetical protein